MPPGLLGSGQCAKIEYERLRASALFQVNWAEEEGTRL